MTIAFAHPSEQEYAELLDALGVPWEYEPRTFVPSTHRTAVCSRR